ncbi:SPOR domain-containing protein [Sphingomonas sp.]|uniref:SPOR domain-containing protein n=1 Tax=Sphingomonas sp. TaxID=28214 RepID=UPI002DD6369C|nr:SPOR domain-containing protein [Sphingomonas sp.]
MKSLASLPLLLFATVAPAQEPAGAGPRGSSQLNAGEVRYDRVGYAGQAELPGIRVASPDLPIGSFAEVTALDTGRTIAVEVAARSEARDRVLDLSAAAVAALGLGLVDARAPVRVRRLTPSPQDIAGLRSGQGAESRADAPEGLLVALRRKLPAKPVAQPAKPSPTAVTPKPKPLPVAQQPSSTPTPVVTRPKPVPPPVAPKPRPTPAPTPVAIKPKPVPTPVVTGRYVVQVAALSNAQRAAAVAKAVGGTVLDGPPVWRVRLGPFADNAAAARARDDAARKGYAGGQILRLP